MSYSDVFGGGTVDPSRVSYLAVALSEDISLFWPVAQQVGGDEVVADIMDVTPDTSGLSLSMPDARMVGNGENILFVNSGADTYTVQDAVGGTLLTVASGEAWVLYLTDNSTESGSWSTFQFGAGSSSANAASLVGAGIKAISTTLNQKMDVEAFSSSPVDIEDDDRAVMIRWTGGVGTANLPDPATVGADWFVVVKNNGSGTLTVNPTSGNVDGQSSFDVQVRESVFFVTDGSNFFAIGSAPPPTTFFDFVSISLPDEEYTLSGTELNRIAYRFTGTLTDDRNVIVPTGTQQYWVDNDTDGGFDIVVKTASGSGVRVTPGSSIIVYCDGIDVVAADSFEYPLSVALGGTGADNAAGARTNLSVPPNSRSLSAGAGLTGGGTLADDRTFNVGSGNGVDVNADDVALDTSHVRNVDHTAVSLLAGTGVDATGLGDISADRTINLDETSDLNVDHSIVSLMAGDGISSSGLGDLTASRTINVDMLGLEALADPGADRIFFWDDSEGIAEWLEVGTGLEISGTTLQLSSGFQQQTYTGFVNSDGTDAGSNLPSGWTVTKGGTGTYTITHGLGLSSPEDLCVVAAAIDVVDSSQSSKVNSLTSNSFNVVIDSDINDTDAPWFFMAQRIF